MALKFRPITDSFGAEVIGVDPGLDLDADTFAEIENAWRLYSVLLFRNLHMSPDQHVAFTRRLGPTHIMEPLEFNLQGYPEVFIVSNVEEGGKAVGLKRAGWGWHSDGEDKKIPNAGSMLYAHVIPPEGGDTMFADTYGAFAALPEDVRRAIMGRRACFSRIRLHHVHYPHMKPLTEQQKIERADVWHPIARRHPKTGWTSLFIGRWACEIEGIPDAEAKELIEFLLDFSHRPEFVYSHQWRVGDAVLWDNRCTQHCAMPFDDAAHKRLMHRTTLEGETPIMAETPVLRPKRAAAAE